eukprot:4356871-Prymnesium_polylepis.1
MPMSVLAGRRWERAFRPADPRVDGRARRVARSTCWCVLRTESDAAYRQPARRDGRRAGHAVRREEAALPHPRARPSAVAAAAPAAAAPAAQRHSVSSERDHSNEALRVPSHSMLGRAPNRTLRHTRQQNIKRKLSHI